jgi:arylsulfatase
VADAETAQATNSSRPNVIIFLADDVGYGDLACLGNPQTKTPFLDKLYTQSVRLNNYHVTPMCTPTRSELLTGRHCLDNEANLVNCGRSTPRVDFPMMQEVFKANGYATGMFGKWHLTENGPFTPNARGFEEALYFPGSCLGTTRDFWNNNGFDSTVLHNGVRKKYPGYITDVWNDEAMTWMEKQQMERKPFFCYLPSNLIHGPEFVEDSRIQKFRDKGYDETHSRIYAALERYDAIFGRVDSFLEKSGLKDNTIIIYFGDNGANKEMTEVYNAGMRGFKKSVYDGGHRNACFVRWPGGGWQGARDFNSLTEVQDLFPTLMEACSLKPIDGLKLEGSSLVKGLQGKPMPELDDRILVVQYGHYGGDDIDEKPDPGEMDQGHRTGPVYGNASVMWNKWRFVNGKELYDIQADPGQKRDLASEHPDVVARLSAYYHQWWMNFSPDARPLQAIPIGGVENPVKLDISSWDGVWADFSNTVREGQAVNGVWHLKVMQSGNYTFILRRWPEELGLPMRAPAPKGPWPYSAGKALPIAKVRLEIQGETAIADVSKETAVVRLTLPLKAGRARLRTAFLDKNGKELCGIYYTDVELDQPAKEKKTTPGK